MAYYATQLITGTTAAAALSGSQPIRRPPDIARGQGDLQAIQGSIVFASGVNIAINDVIELAVLPADHILVDWILVNDDFDSATTVTVKAGIMTGAPGDASRALATVGVELLASGATTLQAPAVTRGSVVASIGAYRLAPATTDRSIGLGIVAAPTNPATVRQLDFIMFYRWASYGL